MGDPIDQPGSSPRATFDHLLAAVIANDLTTFRAVCDDTMRAAITAGTLSAVSKQVAPRVWPGCTILALGELRQRGHDVHLFRLRFVDDGDDLLGTLSLRNGQVSGFYLR